MKSEDKKVKDLMKVKLDGIDRVYLPHMLPEKGGFLDMITYKEIKDMVDFKSDEFADYGIAQNPLNGTLSWDPQKIKTEKEFSFNDHQVRFIKEALKKLDDRKEITKATISTYVKLKEM